MLAEEIDSTYEAAKTKLEEDYLKGLKEGKDSKVLRGEFDKGMTTALNKYNTDYSKLIKSSVGKKQTETAKGSFIADLLRKLKISK